MLGAFAWGTIAASSLIIGALIAFLFKLGNRVIGLIMGFGAGVLISAVAFDLVEEAAGLSRGQGAVVIGLFAGCFTFAGGDWLIARFGGKGRKGPTGKQSDGTPLAIVLGTVLDGIPESIVIGLTIFSGGTVGVAYLVAVFLSNLPESISSTTGLLQSGWKKSRVLWMWTGITLVSGLASAAGFGLFQSSPPETIAFVLTFAAGAILTMLANTMIPEAFEHGGHWAGVMLTLGFAVAFALHSYT